MSQQTASTQTCLDDCVIVDECPKSSEIDQVKTVPIDTTSTTTPIFTHTVNDVSPPIEPTCDDNNRYSLATSDEAVCRICHDVEDEGGKTKMVSPCGCTGSAQYIHKKCLRKWAKVKGTTKCEICHQDYKPKYIRLRHRLLTRQVICMGSAASLPLLVVILVGFFLLGEQLNLGHNGDEMPAEVDSDVDDIGSTKTSKIMVSVCMIATAAFGVFLLCCFSVWAAHVQPQTVSNMSLYNRRAGSSRQADVEAGGETGTGNGDANTVRTQAPSVPPGTLFFF